MDAVTLPAALMKHQPAIAELCRRLGVTSLELFGSAATGTDVQGHSDYDFLVQLDPDAQGSRAMRLIDLAEALEALLGRPVDLVDPGSIRNPYFAAEVARTRIPVHA
jgi:predicted nucleotidyltransferase